MYYRKKWPLMFLIPILLFGFYGQPLIAQNNYEAYHKTVNRANSFKDIDSTIYYFEKAIKLALPFSKDLKSLAFNYYKDENLKMADTYFLKAVAFGYQFEDDPGFEDLLFKTSYEFGFLKKYTNATSPYALFIKTMAERNLEQMRKARQTFLSQLNFKQDDAYKVFLQNEYYFQYVRLKILPAKKLGDSEFEIANKHLSAGNSYLMLELLRKNEFPDHRLCSRFNNQTISMLLNHSIAGFIDKEDAKEFIDLLWNEVKTGNLTPYDYAKAYDHYISWYVDDTRTYFGTTLYRPEGYDTTVCMDVLYPEKLNELRETHWLIPIEDFCSKTGIQLPLNYTH